MSSSFLAHCLPGQPEPAHMSRVLQNVHGVFIDTFGDLMENPNRGRSQQLAGGLAPPQPHPSSSASSSASRSAGGHNRPYSSLPSNKQTGNKQSGGTVRETFFQKLQRVSSQPALAQTGPSIHAIGDGLLRGGRDPLSANGSISQPGPRSRPRVPQASKGKAD